MDLGPFCTWHVLASQMWFDLSEPWQDSGVARAECSLRCFNILVDGLARAVHVACPGVSLMEVGTPVLLANSTQMILLSWLTP